MLSLKFLGHAAFQLDRDGNETLLMDPFITGNPQAETGLEEIGADYILISHGHDDHLGDAFAIAKAHNSLIISTSEIARLASKNGLNSHAQHLGGKHKFSFGSVKLTLAFHGAGIPGGHACGFVIEYFNQLIYFAGDTALFGDMKLIGDLHKLDVALLPIGDNFTMGLDDAVVATTFLKPRLVIPYHYNTWPVIEADPEDFKTKVESNTESKCVILKAGQRLSL